MNAPFVHEQAAGFARRLLAVKVGDDRARIQVAFSLLHQRQSTPAEVEHGAVFVKQYPGSDDEKWAAWSRVLITTNEFLYLD